MKLTIETENPAEIAHILAALSGSAPAAPAAAAAPKAKAEKKEAPAPEPVAPATVQSSAPASTQASGAQPSGTGQTATTGASPSDVPDEATLTAAANAAIGKLGPGAQAKIKDHIAHNYTKDDGSPAGLRTVRVDQRAALLADLQAFANGAKVI